MSAQKVMRDAGRGSPFQDSQISSGKESCKFETVRTDRQTNFSEKLTSRSHRKSSIATKATCP